MIDVETRLQDLAARRDDPTSPPPIEELVQRIRRRRRHRTTGLAACAAAVLVLVGTAVAVSNDRTNVRAADEPEDTTTTTTIDSSSTTLAIGGTGVTTTTTAGADHCRNSYDPSCGPFRWDPSPGPNRNIDYRFTITPKEPKVGETVTFHLVVDDDATLEPASVRILFGDEHGVHDRPPMDDGCPTYRTRYGPWAPPAKVQGHLDLSFTHVYREAGNMPLAFTIYSARCDVWSRGVPQDPEAPPDKRYNPYASYGSYFDYLLVAPADDGTTTTTTTSTTETTLLSP